MSSGKDVIIGEISTSMSKLLGPSSAAMMRKAGMAASNRIWPELPTGKTFEEAGEIMSSAIDDLGGFGHFRVTGVVDGVAQIEFENCFFRQLHRCIWQAVWRTSHLPLRFWSGRRDAASLDRHQNQSRANQSRRRKRALLRDGNTSLISQIELKQPLKHRSERWPPIRKAFFRH
jgi:hypothetical protein